MLQAPGHHRCGNLKSGSRGTPGQLIMNRNPRKIRGARHIPGYGLIQQGIMSHNEARDVSILHLFPGRAESSDAPETTAPTEIIKKEN